MLSHGSHQSVQSVKRAGSATRRKRREAEARWALIAFVLTMTRLQSDVNMVEEMELQRLEPLACAVRELLHWVVGLYHSPGGYRKVGSNAGVR